RWRAWRLRARARRRSPRRPPALSLRAALAIAVALLAAACSSLPATPPAPPQQGAAIAQAAAALVGTRYRFGGADAAGFDCSGLARYVHERVGVAIPRTAAEQQRAAHPVPLAELAPGADREIRRPARRRLLRAASGGRGPLLGPWHATLAAVRHRPRRDETSPS